MTNVTISTEFQKVTYSTKFSSYNVIEPVKYLNINGVKVTVASCISALSNANELSFSENKSLYRKQSERFILNILAPKVEKIISLLRLTF